MAKAKVVEMRALTSNDITVPLARFVLTSGGEVRLVELSPNALGFVQDQIKRGIRGRDRWLHPEDGLEFLTRLPQVFAGTYLWATEVFEMDEAEALRGYPEAVEP